MTKKIEALDITVLKGGAVEVGNWAREHGYFLPPDAPEVLAFYAERSPIFLAARFNAERAANRGVQTGQGTPVHIVIPTPSPWVPLRILALGRKASEIVQADVYLLTDRRPETLPQAERSKGFDQSQRGLIQEVSEPASTTLLTDLRSDRGMKWLPESGMWLTYIRINETAANLTHDLAIDASGYGNPSPVAAGYPAPGAAPWSVVWTVMAALAAVAILMAVTDPGARRQASRGSSVDEAAGGGGRGGAGAPRRSGSGIPRRRRPRQPTGPSASRSTTRSSNRPISPSSPARRSGS